MNPWFASSRVGRWRLLSTRNASPLRPGPATIDNARLTHPTPTFTLLPASPLFRGPDAAE